MKHIAIDLDGTILNFDGKFVPGVYTNPMEGALAFIKALLARGHRVTIFTARSNTKRVGDWLTSHGFPKLNVTSEKSGFDMFLDDRAMTFPGPSFYNDTEAAIKAVEEFKSWWDNK